MGAMQGAEHVHRYIQSFAPRYPMILTDQERERAERCIASQNPNCKAVRRRIEAQVEKRMDWLAAYSFNTTSLRDMGY